MGRKKYRLSLKILPDDARGHYRLMFKLKTMINVILPSSPLTRTTFVVLNAIFEKLLSYITYRVRRLKKNIVLIRFVAFLFFPHLWVEIDYRIPATDRTTEFEQIIDMSPAGFNTNPVLKCVRAALNV